MAHGPNTDEALRRIARSRGRFIDLSGLRLTSLPDLPAGIVRLNINSNRLTVLPALPVSLHILQCEENLLTTLPDLPPNLDSLFCARNRRMTVLPTLPNTLSLLSCSYCSLTELPALPPTLLRLDCDGNQLTALPDLLPPSIDMLICSHNRLTVVPLLPDSITNLRFDNNPIQRVTLPFPMELNDMLMDIVFADTRLQYAIDETFGQYQFRMEMEPGKEKARNVRNARLVGTYKQLPTDVESSIASFVSGIPAEGPGSKNVVQQQDLGREQAGVPGVMRDPNYYKQFSGRRHTRRRRRSKKVVRR